MSTAWQRWRACERKKRYGSCDAAERARLRTGNARTQRGLVVYTCEHCGGFHVGHRGKRFRDLDNEKPLAK